MPTPTKKPVVAAAASVVLPTQRTTMATRVQDYILMFYGPPGVGKTTFVDQLAPRVLFLSTDRGTRFLNTMRVECHSWAKFEQVVKTLEAPGAAKQYDLVCIDHVDDMANMAEDSVCKRLGIESLGDAGYGKGWKAYRRAIESFVQRLLKLGIGVVFVCHEEIKTVRTRAVELDRTMPLLSKSSWKVIVPMADIIGYCGYRTLKLEGGKRKEIRVLETVPREDLYVKDRTRRVRPSGPYELLDGSKFLATFSGNGVKHEARIPGNAEGQAQHNAAREGQSVQQRPRQQQGSRAQGQSGPAVGRRARN